MNEVIYDKEGVKVERHNKCPYGYSVFFANDFVHKFVLAVEALSFAEGIRWAVANIVEEELVP